MIYTHIFHSHKTEAFHFGNAKEKSDKSDSSMDSFLKAYGEIASAVYYAKGADLTLIEPHTDYKSFL
jgi:hypothetical protein